MRREGRDRSTRLIFLNRLRDFLIEKKITDASVWAALNEQFKPFRNKLVYGASEGVRAGVRVAKRLAKRTVAKPLWEWLRSKYYREEYSPPAGWVRFGNLRRRTPIARDFGWHRGLPADRYYIEKFLDAHRDDIRGRVLEIGDPAYTKKFGGERVTQSEVLHAVAGNPLATIVGDLQTGEGVPADAFDCIILTQVLPFLYDFHAAIDTCMRALKPGGVLLLTVPCISQVSPFDRDRWGDYWRFTSGAIRKLLSEVAPSENVAVRSYGNVLVAASFLYGVTADELTREELDSQDEEFELIVTARAVKAPAVAIARPIGSPNQEAAA
jgi:SAM-dependent methyltransferase